ncbi:MAG: SDR family oxidoreductase [Oscillospiraceae bacterium]|jgi:NAD(P)-dependent dehydrogenase (short-subunit alcohol dehydrogenase family)|nr:SDR family oxidoreductase [Oscillospiraceae bacterium]
MDKINGAVAFVTGGASGLGLGIAKALAKHGASVAIADARQAAIDEALQWFKAKGFTAKGVLLNVTDREAYIKAAADVTKELGNITILVNNAGVAAGAGPAWLATEKDWNFMVQVNILGVANGIAAIVPLMLEHKQPSSVVSTSSTGGFFGVTGSAVYCACKFAVSGLMETLAGDLDGTNVTAHVLYPGPTNSNLGFSSAQVRPAELQNAPAPAPAPAAPKEGEEAPRFEMPPLPFMNPEELGERVVRGILRGDLFIHTHPEFKAGLQLRSDAIIKAIPDEPENTVRKDVVAQFGTLMYNPLYEKQTTPGLPDWTVDWE